MVKECEREKSIYISSPYICRSYHISSLASGKEKKENKWASNKAGPNPTYQMSNLNWTAGGLVQKPTTDEIIISIIPEREGFYLGERKKTNDAGRTAA